MRGAAMEKTVKRKKEENPTGVKKSYLTPSLVCYGTLKELTRAGISTPRESGPHPGGRP